MSNETIFRPTGRIATVPYDADYDKIRANLDVQRGSFWTADKVKGLFEKDKNNFAKIPTDIGNGLKMGLKFFLFADEKVEDVISKSCLNRITIPEIIDIYKYEAMMEKVHSEVYNLNFQAIVTDVAERESLKQSVETDPLVAAKVEFVERWITDTRKPAYTVVGKVACEGINFSSIFAYIDWLNYSCRYDLPGTFISNEEISRDEARHVDTGFLVYEKIQDRLTPDNVAELLEESERLECLFAGGMIPDRHLDGMSVRDMCQHIRHCKAHAAAGLGFGDMYKGTSSPFLYMEKRSLNKKTNFFEKESAEYGQLDESEPVPDLIDIDDEC